MQLGYVINDGDGGPRLTFILDIVLIEVLCQLILYEDPLEGGGEGKLTVLVKAVFKTNMIKVMFCFACISGIGYSVKFLLLNPHSRDGSVQNHRNGSDWFQDKGAHAPTNTWNAAGTPPH